MQSDSSTDLPGGEAEPLGIDQSFKALRTTKVTTFKEKGDEILEEIELSARVMVEKVNRVRQVQMSRISLTQGQAIGSWAFNAAMSTPRSGITIPSPPVPRRTAESSYEVVFPPPSPARIPWRPRWGWMPPLAVWGRCGPQGILAPPRAHHPLR